FISKRLGKRISTESSDDEDEDERRSDGGEGHIIDEIPYVTYDSRTTSNACSRSTA
ncbi:unnamed protein product, partial [Amoebophrya sp. A25]